MSKAPLDAELRGISIFSRGVWHETTLAGNEGREMAQFIFGDVEVPQLDDDDSPIPPFDATRSMQLNPSNGLVCTLYAFVSHGVESVRRELLDAERRRRADEEAKKLDEQANEIARLINDDFDNFSGKLARVKALGLGRVDLGRPVPSAEVDGTDVVPGTSTSAKVRQPSGGAGAVGGDGGGGAGAPRLLAPELERDAEGSPIAQPATGLNAKRSGRAGFRVRFVDMGSESNRAKYASDDRTIYLNLEHPQFAAALEGTTIEDVSFRRLAYEVAFSEYALALALELAQREGYYSDPTDPVVEIIETLNRLARKGAYLYSAAARRP